LLGKKGYVVVVVVVFFSLWLATAGCWFKQAPPEDILIFLMLN